MLPRQACGAPGGDEQPDDEEEPRPAGAELPFGALGTLAAPCRDEREPVAEDERRPQREDHLGEQAVEVEDVGHGPSVAARIADRKPPVRSHTMRTAAVVRVFTRGAEGGNLLRFERDFPGAKIVRLERNYRSTGNILAAASALIANNAGRLGKTLWTESGEGDKVRVTGVWDGDEEARVVGDEVDETLREIYSG